MGAAELLGARLRNADAPDLALILDAAELTDRVLDRDRRINAVKIIEIDMIDAEPLQARLDGCARSERRPVVAGLPVRELAGDDETVAIFADRLAEQLLVMARAIADRGIEEGDTKIDRAVDGAHRLRVVRATIAV